jgi:putative PEP-CTERM system integral membrane protein
LSEKRNVFWDTSTNRSLLDAPVADAWLPASLPARARSEPQTHQITFATGEAVSIRPASSEELEPMVARSDLHLAVVLDRSRSMGRHRDYVQQSLQQLGAFSDVDVYLTTSAYRREPATRVRLSDFDLNALDYVGGQQASELLVQFDSLRAATPYDAVLVLTDGKGFDLDAPKVELPTFAFPVWMVHVANELPLGYDDGTLAAIQSSGGGIAGSVDEMLTRHAVQTLSGARVVDGYVWTSTTGEAVASSDAFAAFAARHLILDAMQRHGGSATHTAVLDNLHAIAKSHAIVTPYSSMIVLVNADQQRRLAELERQGDRFEREGEAAGETVPASLTNVTAVPEPHEWLLMGVAILILGGWLKGNQGRQMSLAAIVSGVRSHALVHRFNDRRRIR